MSTPQTQLDLPSPTWQRQWQKTHRATACSAPLPRHLQLARCLHLAGADSDSAGLATAAAAVYERDLQKVGGDASATSRKVRELILYTALTR